MTIAVEGAQGQTPTFRSSDSKIATVDANGQVTANGVGQAVITVTAGGKSAQCYVNVSASGGSFTTSVLGGGCVITAYTGTEDSVIIPDRINGLPVVAIGNSAFKGKSITSISIPSTVTSIAPSAFEGCAHLATVTLSSSLTEIGDRAFASCGVLRSVDLPASLKTLGTSAFERCYALTTVYLPSSLTNIGDRAVRYCSSITLYVSNGSPAMNFAVQNGLSYTLIG